MKAFYLLSLLVTAAIAIVVLPAPVFSGGPDPKYVQPTEAAGEASVLVSCTEPRPQICTREYMPVCAQLEDGSFKTYATGCTACADPQVSGYRDGACVEEQ